MTPDPFAPWRASMAFWTMMAEAQQVMAIRLMGLAGVLPMSARERTTMVHEKGPAFARAAMAAGIAAATGKDAASVAEAAIGPIGRRTRSNLRRLTAPKRG